MAWLGTLLKKSPQEEVGEEEQEEEQVAEAPPESSGPPLVLLVPNVAGVGAFRFVAFPDVQSAAEYIDSSVLPEVRSGLTAFWALHHGPQEKAPDGAGEALVLIRSAADSNVVYVVSFVDLESAESFARFEVKRGLDLGLVMIYWAALVTVHQGPHGVSLTPAEPPTYAGAVSPEALRAAEEPPAEEAHPEKPAAQAAAIAEARESPPAEARREAPPVGAEAGDRNADAPVVEEAAEAGAPEAVEGGLDRGAASTAGDEEREALDAGEVLAAATKILAGDEELIGEGAPAAETSGTVPKEGRTDRPVDTQPASEAVGPGAAAPAVIEEEAADHQKEPGPSAGAQVPQLAPPGDEQAEEDEIARAVQKLLRNRRWEKKDTPFRGFNSPPGRF